MSPTEPQVGPVETLTAWPEAVDALRCFDTSVSVTSRPADPPEGQLTLQEVLAPPPHGNPLAHALCSPFMELKHRRKLSEVCERLAYFNALMEPALFGGLQAAWRRVMGFTVCSWETTARGTVVSHRAIPRRLLLAIDMAAEDVLRRAFDGWPGAPASEDGPRLSVTVAAQVDMPHVAFINKPPPGRPGAPKINGNVEDFIQRLMDADEWTGPKAAAALYRREHPGATITIDAMRGAAYRVGQKRHRNDSAAGSEPK